MNQYCFKCKEESHFNELMEEGVLRCETCGSLPYTKEQFERLKKPLNRKDKHYLELTKDINKLIDELQKDKVAIVNNRELFKSKIILFLVQQKRIT